MAESCCPTAAPAAASRLADMSRLADVDAPQLRHVAGEAGARARHPAVVRCRHVMQRLLAVYIPAEREGREGRG